MEVKRYAVVTGANKGIGYETCRQLALNGIEVILTARNQSRGEEAVEKLKNSGLSNVIFHQLDINDPHSIARLAKFVETRYGKLDILINNAGEVGIAIKEKEFREGGANLEIVGEETRLNVIEQTYELGEKCVQTNYYATKMVTESLIPLLQLSKSPRIVNVTSAYGHLYYFHNQKLKEELLDVENLTEEKIDKIIQWFLTDFKACKLEENAWPLVNPAYRVSKVALNAYTMLMARKHENMLVNCVHPGYVITDMTSQTGYITAEEGAKVPVMAALLPNNGPSGVYFHERKVAPYSPTEFAIFIKEYEGK